MSPCHDRCLRRWARGGFGTKRYFICSIAKLLSCAEKEYFIAKGKRGPMRNRHEGERIFDWWLIKPKRVHWQLK